MSRGAYSLVVEVARRERAEVGALGAVTFEPGWYAYAGSALGHSGFARVRRHHEVACGERAARHWHVDALLGLAESTVDVDFRTPAADVADANGGSESGRGEDTADPVGECTIAANTAGEPIAGFGATDCDCHSHLHFSARRDELVSSLSRAHDPATTGVEYAP